MMLVLLSEPACKRCWTRRVGGEDELFQWVLFAGVPKGPAKDPHRDNAMKGRTVTTSGKWPKETTRSNRRK